MNHASKRSLSRYGLEMTVDEQLLIASMIERGQGKKLHRSRAPYSNGAEVWAVHWDKLGRVIPVVYLQGVRRIATILPEVCLTRGRRFRELDVDWLDDDDDDALDAEALAGTTLEALRSEVANDVLRVKLSEALNLSR